MLANKGLAIIKDRLWVKFKYKIKKFIKIFK